MLPADSHLPVADGGSAAARTLRAQRRSGTLNSRPDVWKVLAAVVVEFRTSTTEVVMKLFRRGTGSYVTREKEVTSLTWLTRDFWNGRWPLCSVTFGPVQGSA